MHPGETNVPCTASFHRGTCQAPFSASETAAAGQASRAAGRALVPGAREPSVAEQMDAARWICSSGAKAQAVRTGLCGGVRHCLVWNQPAWARRRTGTPTQAVPQPTCLRIAQCLHRQLTFTSWRAAPHIWAPTPDSIARQRSRRRAVATQGALEGILLQPAGSKCCWGWWRAETRAGKQK